MKTMTLTATFTMIALMSLPAFAKPSLKMVCSLDVISADGATEFLQNDMFFSDQDVVEIAGKTNEVAPGYERYAAVITNSQKGFLVTLLDGRKVVSSRLISYSSSDFQIKAPIDNLKFDHLRINCGGALGPAN